jgi:hypothetical protein
MTSNQETTMSEQPIIYSASVQPPAFEEQMDTIKAKAMMRDDRAGVVLPNGDMVANVYEAYESGVREATRCPVCQYDRVSHNTLDVWACLDKLRGIGGKA